MTQRVIVDVVSHVPRALIDSNYPATRSAATVRWTVVGIQSHIPQHNALGPVATAIDNQVVQHSAKRICLATLPRASRSLSNKGIFVWVFIVQDGLPAHVAAIPVPGNARNKLGRAGIRQHRLGIVECVPVMIVSENPCFDITGGQSWPKVILDKAGLLTGGHTHSRIAGGNV